MNSKILRNTSYLFSAQILTKIIGFIYTIFLLRFLSLESYGLYTVALAYFAIISSFSELGFNRYIVREGAINEKELPKLVTTVALLRIGLTLLILALFAVTVHLLDSDFSRLNLSLLAVLAIIPQSLSLTFDAVLVAKQNLKLSAIAGLILSIVNAILGLWLISLGFDTYGPLLSLILSFVIYCLILLWMISSLGVKLVDHVDKKLAKEVFLGSIPYGILGVLGLLYFRVDVIMLSYLRSVEETGLYGAAYRFIEAVTFIPTVVSAAIFPVLAKLQDKRPDEVRQIYFKSLKIMAGLGVVITVAFIFILPFVIRALLSPEYISSINILIILSLTIPFMFIHLPATLVLLSSNKHLKSVIYLSFITLFFNISTNYLIIPHYGASGAAFTTVLSEVLTFLIFFFFLYFKVLKK